MYICMYLLGMSCHVHVCSSMYSLQCLDVYTYVFIVKSYSIFNMTFFLSRKTSLHFYSLNIFKIVYKCRNQKQSLSLGVLQVVSVLYMSRYIHTCISYMSLCRTHLASKSHSKISQPFTTHRLTTIGRHFLQQISNHTLHIFNCQLS